MEIKSSPAPCRTTSLKTKSSGSSTKTEPLTNVSGSASDLDVFRVPPPPIEHGDVDAAVGVTLLEMHPVRFMEQIRRENHGAIATIRNGHGLGSHAGEIGLASGRVANILLSFQSRRGCNVPDCKSAMLGIEVGLVGRD